ncbi:MAG: hypothetical protein DRN13_00665 [Thermoplasmata archaeon]|nr:MAG: hypothetical protein DRN13_00665 [Thermoplasmata archaeon]
MRIKAVLFDLDGVLIDSLDAWWLALNEALRRYGFEEIDKKEFIERYWGNDLYSNLDRANLPLEVGLTCSKLYMNYIDMIRLHPSAIEILESMEGIKKGLITNTPRDCTEMVLKRFDLEKYFDVVITGDDVSRGKPDPEIIVKACDHLNVKPQEVVVIGDTDNDLKAARSAGCSVIGIGLEGDIYLDDLSELRSVLKL